MEKSDLEQRKKARMGALSAPKARWQSCWCAGLVLSLATLTLAPPAYGWSEGPVFTVRRGDYVCELPGTALTSAGLHQPAEDFSILHGSSYTTTAGRGAYFATGDEIRMTSGPKTGQRFRRISENFLRKLTADGQESDLRCIRRVLNNN